MQIQKKESKILKESVSLSIAGIYLKYFVFLLLINCQIIIFHLIIIFFFESAKDKYESKLNFLLEKIKDLIKNPESTAPSLLILVFFFFTQINEL